VHSTDDRDPMKEVPKRVMDLDGKWHDLQALGDYSKYVGHPYSRIPDPFSCCETWSRHFTKVWVEGLHMLGMEPELYSTEQLYSEGRLDKWVQKMFENIELAREVIAKYQKTKNAPDYVPFNAICEKCGRITAKVVGFDLEKKTVDYECTAKKLKKRESEGCGHKGTTSWRNGKLTWRFESLNGQQCGLNSILRTNRLVKIMLKVHGLQDKK